MDLQDDKGGLSAALTRLTDGLSRLVADHLALARAELKADARAFGQGAVRVAVFVPLLLLGYGFLCAALAAGLANLMPLWLSLLLVGLLNIAVGALGAYLAANGLKTRTPRLPQAMAQAQVSAQVLAHAARGPKAAAAEDGGAGGRHLGA